MVLRTGRKTFLAFALIIALLAGPLAALPSVHAEGTVQGFLRESGADEAGKSLDLTYGIRGVEKPVLAQDFTVTYDPELIVFTGAESLKSGVSIVDQSEEPGLVRLIAASNGKERAVREDGDVIVLHWKAKASVQTAAASVALGHVAVSSGEDEGTPAARTAFLMNAAGSLPGDVNGNGEVTVGDLGIVAAAVGKTSADPDWENYARADVNLDGKVDSEDLAIVAAQMLEAHPVLVILTGANSARAGQSFVVTYGLIGQTQNIFAQDMLLTYDADKLEFLSYDMLDQNRYNVVDVDEKSGQIRFIGARLGTNSEDQGGNLMKLNFKAKANAQAGAATVAVSQLITADGDGVETNIAGTSRDIAIIEGVEGDYNNDGKVSIGDLALMVQAYGKTKNDPDWDSVKRFDLVADGAIDIEDLVKMAKLILEQ